jgi:hypothetical protein
LSLKPWVAPEEDGSAIP